MISNLNDKTQSMSRKNIRVTDILVKSNEKINRKSTKRYQHDSIDYGTDEKKKSSSQSYLGDIQQMRAVILSCESCMEKISQFTTKKPRQHTNKCEKVEDKSTQTVNKPFLVDLIEERVNQLCRQNRKLSKMLVEKQTQIVERQTQISEIQDRFTSILYNLGQQISYLKTISLDADELKQGTIASTETPSYLKALVMQSKR